MKATVLSVKGENEDLELDSSDANPAELRDAKYDSNCFRTSVINNTTKIINKNDLQHSDQK